jgi:hypothetical protein
MPSIVSNGTDLLCRGGGYHRLMGVERAHSVLAVPSKVPDYGCPFAPEKVTRWSIIRATRGDGAGPTPSSARPHARRDAVRRVPVADAGIELVRNGYRSIAVSVVTGGTGSDGD